ncbi:MAG TPA: hypothetical protein VHZ06_10245 [Marmoricola sp.]|jgi:hypothetical protein|nr:hypothetical protein [Marmoricola sp.]
MSAPLHRRTAGVVAGALAALGLVALPGGTSAQAAAPTPTVLSQTIHVAWAGAAYKGGATATAIIPGIGNVTAVCRRNDTMVQLSATNRAAENQMWIAKYETKNDEPVVAVKTVRVYTYSNRDDVSGSGTGPLAHEGLNQLGNIENSASGYMHGVISQRPGRNADAATAYAPPSTSFSLTWSWNGFRKKPKDSSCNITARFITDVTNATSAANQIVAASQMKVIKFGKKKKRVGRTASVAARAVAGLALSWHGDADEANASQRTAVVPGIGPVTLTCQTGRDGEASISIAPTSTNSSAYVEDISGEGVVEDHVDDYSLLYDPETGEIGPIDLPSNGMMRLYMSSGGHNVALIISSYRITNNDAHPELNLCEVATAPWYD